MIGFALPISERSAQEQRDKEEAKSHNNLGENDDDDEVCLPTAWFFPESTSHMKDRSNPARNNTGRHKMGG
ncbi:hypothetical protein PSHT_11565 [Puccinia striiformis]|uniref:Uncharacterized protein n=2 Tax=Puccinia striiformis TaxID=27350 RepID=A0A0L0UPV7_9BASI|nr:hypothetical protein Pst134EB_031041 [Puccinia striiformis f. sp. tritici]KNE89117.1 hypothetical protein PSTG_17426 [Puccinia striiformis f. sp. tritici PST-78]POW03697.1 hypothetical protein PSHT_11565 [Puccinia striiformis]